MNLNQHFIDLYDHMEWADAAMWSAVLASESAAGDRVTLKRCQHIHLVQRTFLHVWRGEPIDVHAGEGLEARALAAWARGYYAEARAHIRHARIESFSAVQRLPWTDRVAERLGFAPAPTTLADTLVQVYWHTTHHRGQIATRLSELAAAPPLFDYIAWVWQGRRPAAWPS